MPTHTVAQGECLSSIAKQYGFHDYRTIYEHGNNADFRQLRKNPNVIKPGDQLFIPDKDQKIVERPTGASHRFQVQKRKTMLRIIVKDEDTPLRNQPYTLEVEDQKFEGTTDGDGLLKQEIPPDAVEGVLRMQHSVNGGTHSLEWQLRLGHLDPVDEISGAQARLNNLGFFCGAVDGVSGPRTEGALRSFQKKHGLAETGQLDDATQALLRDSHDQSS